MYEFIGYILVVGHVLIFGRHVVDFFAGESSNRGLRADVIVDGEMKFSVTPQERD